MLNFTVERIPYQECKEWLLYKHYAKRIPGSILYSFGLFYKNEIIGICTYGMSPNFNNNKIGNYDCIELNRLIVNDHQEKNLTSWFISQTFKQIKKPVAIISYSDEGQGHYGYIYQACNFIYTGKSSGVELYEFENGKIISKRALDQQNINQEIKLKKHGKTFKHRYFYFLGNKKQIKEMNENLKYKIEPYPKGQNKNYDASYQPTIQGKLF